MSYPGGTTYGISAAYDFYKRDQYRPKIKRRVYLYLMRDFFKFLRDMLINEGIRFILPYRMGSLQVVGVKDKPKVYGDGKIFGVAINWQETRKLWKEKPELKNKEYVYYTNTHSDGYRFKMFWSKKGVIIHTKGVYVFKLSRQNRKKIYLNIISGNDKYERK